ncbi:MAG: Maf family protein [Solirubrobacteraceae bacterium]
MPGARLVLASRSPQRRAILEQLGVAFDVAPADVPEIEAGDPAAVALENALRKAAATPGRLVLAADTVVALDGELLGKPRGEEEARAWLRRLAGRTHEVHGGLALRRDGATVSATAMTRVTFRPLAAHEAGWYVATGEWRGRAGGYAIQGRGAALVERIEGDYLNVVGLPLAALMSVAPELVFGASSP